MKKIHRVLAMLMAAIMALSLITTAFAEPTIDPSKKASLSIYKYDITTASAEGAWDAESYVSTGLHDDAVVDKLAKYAIQGVEFTCLRVADVTMNNEVVDGQRTVGVLYGFDSSDRSNAVLSAIGLIGADAHKTEGGINYFTSDMLNNKLSAALAANATIVKNALEVAVKNGGVAMTETDATGHTSASNMEQGLYLVVETRVPENVTSTCNPFFVSLPMTTIDGAAWNYDVTVYPKNQTGNPTLDKTVREAKNSTGKNTGSLTDITDGYAHTASASIGDTVDYQIISTLPTITSKASSLSEYTYIDTMSKGIKYNKNDVVIEFFKDADCTDKIATWVEDSGKFTVAYDDTASTMTIRMTETGLSEINEATTVYSDSVKRGYSDCTMRLTYAATLTADAQMGDTDNLTVIDSSGGNGAVGVTVRDGGTLVFNPENDNTTLLQLEVWGGTVELYGGKISRSGLRLNNNITLGNLLPGQAGLAYYRGDTQLTLEEAASQTCDLVVKLCSHGGKNGFDGTNCPYCNAPAVAQTALRNVEGGGLWRRFADLQTALDADRDGGSTLSLLTDVTGDYTINGTRDTGIDLNGHSIHGTVTVKAATGMDTTTLSNTKNTTTASIDTVVAHMGANLAGSGFPAVIGTLKLAEGATWANILYEPNRLGYKVLNGDGTHKWYAPADVPAGSTELNNVIINRLPIPSKTLSLKVDGKNLTGSNPKVERGTTVRLCANCNAKDADVAIYVGEIGGDGIPTYIQKKAEYKKIGTMWYYVVDFDADTIGTYSIYFTASKDGYSVTSSHKQLTVTKLNLSKAVITFPNGNESVYQPYNTTTGVPPYVVTYNGSELKAGVDYTVVRGDSRSTVGTATLTIKATDDGDYTGQKTARWTVAAHKATISVGDIIKAYDGTTDLPANASIKLKSADSRYAPSGGPLPLAAGEDYQILNASYDSANASEDEKTVSFTIKLTDKNYTFEDGTTQKDFVLNGADVSQTFKISQATVTPNEITQYVFNDLAKTYEIDLRTLLPELPVGCEYGKIHNRGCDYHFTNSTYLDSSNHIFVSNEGILTLPIVAAHSANVNDQIGTLTVPIVSTNYQPFELTIKVVIGQRIPLDQSGVSVSATDITYGQTLAESTLTATGSMICPPHTGRDSGYVRVEGRHHQAQRGQL